MFQCCWDGCDYGYPEKATVEVSIIHDDVHIACYNADTSARDIEARRHLPVWRSLQALQVRKSRVQRNVFHRAEVCGKTKGRDSRITIAENGAEAENPSTTNRLTREYVPMRPRKTRTMQLQVGRSIANILRAGTTRQRRAI